MRQQQTHALTRVSLCVDVSSFSGLLPISFVLSSAFRYCLQAGLEGSGLPVLSRPFTIGRHPSTSNSNPLHLFVKKNTKPLKDCWTAIISTITTTTTNINTTTTTTTLLPHHRPTIITTTPLRQRLFVLIERQTATTCSSASGHPTSFSTFPSKPTTSRLSPSVCKARAPPSCARLTK